MERDGLRPRLVALLRRVGEGLARRLTGDRDLLIERMSGEPLRRRGGLKLDRFFPFLSRGGGVNEGERGRRLCGGETERDGDRRDAEFRRGAGERL